MTPEWRRAALAGDIESMDLQLGDGTDVDALDRYGQTALMLAATEGGLPTVAWLIAQGAELDHTAKFGLSAVMLAAVNGHDRVAVVLAEAGADLSLRGTGAPGFAGKTAADLATERGHEAMTARLAAPTESKPERGSRPDERREGTS